MKYPLIQKRLFPFLLIGVSVAMTISFYVLSRNDAAFSMTMPYVSAGCVVFVLYVIGRFLAFRLLYSLGEDYVDLSFTVYRIRETTSTAIFKIELSGNETLVPFDKKGKKSLKKKKKLGVFTQNLIPTYPYALTCEVDGVEGYILLELNEAYKKAIEARIERARRIASFDIE